ncbi:MAG: exodeoxyribonuclease VII large subunit [Phycisphaerae bacterium]|nr:exodeoxyribonuclease VII large subunit [Phycisphaerae bacterium]MCZ2399142.1 exodeoxyribonuclease VII large subunit [Phycisphaerae bacterium]
MSERQPFDPSRIRPPGGSTPDALPPEPAMLTPRQVNAMIRGAIARHLPRTLHVLGEIGDCSRAGSGHIYFTLKDDESELRCVIWRSDAVRLRFTPETGMQVIATGGVEVYVPRGGYQLIVRRLEPRGVGALEVAFRQMRDRLAREGLLDAERKRPLPLLPERVAVVTSEHGAALRDVLQTLARRCPSIEVFVVPVPVQGAAAAPAIAHAIRSLSMCAAALGIETAIVGRGGGSLEDLWAFNEESVARAVAHCSVPIISAVGHETDVSICDFVADVRAATPTAAAELLAPRRDDLLACVDRQLARVRRGLGHAHELARAQLGAALAREWLARPLGLVNFCAQGLDERLASLAGVLRERLARTAAALHAAELRLLRFAYGAHFARQQTRLAERVTRLQAAALEGLRRRRHELAWRRERLERALHAEQHARCDERIRQLCLRLRRAADAVMAGGEQRVAARLDALRACDPRRVLLRGYSITRDAKTRNVIRSVKQVRDGTRLAIEVADGEFRAAAEDPRQPGLFG